MVTKRDTEITLTTSVPIPVESLYCECSQICDWCFEDEPCKVIQVDKAHFKVILKPRTSGKVELSVTIGGVEIIGSPFVMSAVSLAEMREQGLRVFARGLQHPCGVAVTTDEKYLVVTEKHRHCVTVLSTATGEILRRFGRKGTTSLGDFLHPIELALTADKDIYVKDDYGIQKFTFDGKFSEAFWNCKGYGTAVLPCGNIITGSSDENICQLTPNLQKVDSFCCIHGIHLGDIYSLTVGHDGMIYVLAGDKKIHKFTEEEEYITTFDDTDDLHDPYEMCIDSSNTLYVTDRNQVNMFNSDGEFLGSFCNHRKLLGIAVSRKTDNLYICKANGEVLISHLLFNND